MPNDIADWSSSVVVQSGTVTISGTATVTISGTPTVAISGTPTVTIGNTPAVTVNSGTINIGNTPTVILGAGTASVGSISAIGSTVTVAGTINIGNTPSVSISGTPTVNIGNSPSVNVANATIVVSANQHVTLSSATGVAAISTLSVTALPYPLVRGQKLTLVSGANNQDVTLAVAAQAGATSLSVQAFTPAVNFPIGTFVIFAVPIHLNVGSPTANPVTTLKSGFAAGQAVFTPTDASIFQPGQVLMFNSITAGNSNVGFVKSVNNDGTVTMTMNFTNAMNAGDAVVVLDQIAVLGQPVAVATAASTPPGPVVLIKQPLTNRATLANLATATFVNGVAGQVVYLFAFTVYFDAAGGIDWWIIDAAVTSTPRSRINSKLTDPLPRYFFGAPITAAGNGMGVTNQSGGSLTHTATFIYGQG